MNILITGCSRGIGKEFVQQFLESKNVEKIFAVSQHPESLKDLTIQYPGRLVPIQTSVSEEDSRVQIQNALKDTALDLLVNNAGTYEKEPDDFSEIKIDTLRRTFEVNAYAAFRTCQACLPALEKSKQAKVVQITSLMGSIEDNTSGKSYAYRMSKAALNMFNKCFSIDYPSITSVVFHPGWVQTEMGGKSAPTSPKESVTGMISKIETLSLKETGKFFDYEGDELPW